MNLEHLQTWYATVSDQTDTVFANAISTLVDHLSNEVQELKPGQSNVFLIVLEVFFTSFHREFGVTLNLLTPLILV